MSFVHIVMSILVDDSFFAQAFFISSVSSKKCSNKCNSHKAISFFIVCVSVYIYKTM